MVQKYTANGDDLNSYHS